MRSPAPGHAYKQRTPGRAYKVPTSAITLHSTGSQGESRLLPRRHSCASPCASPPLSHSLPRPRPLLSLPVSLRRVSCILHPSLPCLIHPLSPARASLPAAGRALSCVVVRVVLPPGAPSLLGHMTGWLSGSAAGKAASWPLGLLAWLVGWLAGWLAGWLVGWLVGWLAGWLDCWIAGWLGGRSENEWMDRSTKRACGLAPRSVAHFCTR